MKLSRALVIALTALPPALVGYVFVAWLEPSATAAYTGGCVAGVVAGGMIARAAVAEWFRVIEEEERVPADDRDEDPMRWRESSLL